MANDDNDETAGVTLTPAYPPKALVRYTILIGIVFFVAFIGLIWNMPSADSIAADHAIKAKYFALTTLLMSVAGGLGGCLYNLRGLVKHSTDGDHSTNYNLGYYLRPISGGINGLIVFFLLLGGALAFNIGVDAANGPPAWSTFTGRLPYIVFAILAGYSANEFMQKMKEVAQTLFSVR